ncbi:hypothetical protein N9X53_06005 [Mariniblastus sp.]|nr:hypothetical protein [Mariniblastus sp.]
MRLILVVSVSLVLVGFDPNPPIRSTKDWDLGINIYSSDPSIHRASKLKPSGLTKEECRVMVDTGEVDYGGREKGCNLPIRFLMLDSKYTAANRKARAKFVNNYLGQPGTGTELSLKLEAQYGIPR